MKVPRDESGPSLVKKLTKVGYEVVRQNGSHIRLSRFSENSEHHLTIPNHDPIKVGLLSKILSDVAKNLEISKADLIKFIES